MTPKAAPKYPRQETVLKKRLLGQAFVLLLLIGGALFYAFIDNPAQEHDTLNALDQLAASLSTRQPEPQTALVAQPDTPAPLPVKNDPDQNAPEPPFAGKSLEQIGAELARRYAGRPPMLWNEYMPGITSSLPLPERAKTAQRRPAVLAITLDACGGKQGESFDAEIIEFLRQNRVPATIFVTSIWLNNNTAVLRNLAADPLFEIAAHGARHKPASVNGRGVFGITGTASVAELVREVEGNVRDIEATTGKRPRWFRAGTAFYDDVAVDVIKDLGLGIAGYSIACDEGATLPPDRVKGKILTAGHGDILLLHLNKPRSGTREGLRGALPELKKQGVRFVRLSDTSDGQ